MLLPHPTRIIPLLQRLLWALLFFSSLPLITSCEQRKIIVHDLEERDANEILDFLITRGIDAMKVKGGTEGGGSKVVVWDISVIDRDSSQAMSLLNQYGLPRRRPQELLNIFSGNSLVPSEMSEQIRYQAGLAAQIASTIRKIDGVLDAEVTISFPKEDPLHPDMKQGKITASVYVKYSSQVLEDPNVHLATRIKRLVSSSVTGLDFDNVTVILDKARFADLPFAATAGSGEEKRLVSVWSIAVAEESVMRFRLIFFAFLLILLFLITTLGWFLWKWHHIADQFGGFKALFSLHPLGEASKEPKAEGTETPPQHKQGGDGEGGVT